MRQFGPPEALPQQHPVDLDWQSLVQQRRAPPRRSTITSSAPLGNRDAPGTLEHIQPPPSAEGRSSGLQTLLPYETPEHSVGFQEMMVREAERHDPYPKTTEGSPFWSL